MSSSVRLHAAPLGVTLEPRGLALIFDELLEQRARAAHAAGYAQAVAETAGAMQQAAAALEAATDRRRSEEAHDAVALALAIARQLLRRELDAGRYDLEGIVRDTLAAAAVERGNATVHLHPDDAKRLADVSFRRGTTIEPDVGVERGCVHVETPHGLLVRDIESAVAAIGERITANLRVEHDAPAGESADDEGEAP